MENKPLRLQDLVGVHVLTAVDINGETDHRLPNNVVFTLDKKTYLAVEDPSDGYRSSMDYIALTDTRPENRFKGVKVLARINEYDEYGNKSELLDVINLETGMLILRIGTSRVNDYYPSWVAEFSKENL